MSDVKELEAMEVETLRNQLDLFGVKYHHNANISTLKKLLEDARKETAKSDTGLQTRAEVKSTALKPILVNVTCLNPNKSQLRGEMISFGNRVLGRCKDFIPYNCPESNGIWISQMVYGILKERRFLHTEERRSVDPITGESHSSKWLPEFSVEVIKQ